ncbi:hypothetical protein DBV23_04960 [Edwardsiella ictaluri]|nr:hypothetical protein DBV23_04960 [Edwardsiella ictaluri]BEH97867.1 hypothetical protein KH20906_05950 [Edwardsiella ictaluri]BEI01335.1 hypothetical protein KB20921_05960 [Edwardsiella ictaluri]BEI04808.1 hypothetical protein KH201010_05940 [Edwardsiella ictaluri]BEI08263.1 hypothetical protein STU22726_05940 [Edwardsiella ictaluri]
MAADLFLQSLRQPQRAVLPVRRTPDSASDVARSTLRAGFPLLYTLGHLIQRQDNAQETNHRIYLGDVQRLLSISTVCVCKASGEREKGLQDGRP